MRSVYTLLFFLFSDAGTNGYVAHRVLYVSSDADAAAAAAATADVWIQYHACTVICHATGRVAVGKCGRDYVVT